MLSCFLFNYFFLNRGQGQGLKSSAPRCPFPDFPAPPPSERRWHSNGSAQTVACTQPLFYFSFCSFQKHQRARERSERARASASASAEGEKDNKILRGSYFLSHALDELWRENRGSVNRLHRLLQSHHRSGFLDSFSRSISFLKSLLNLILSTPVDLEQEEIFQTLLPACSFLIYTPTQQQNNFLFHWFLF